MRKNVNELRGPARAAYQGKSAPGSGGRRRESGVAQHYGTGPGGLLWDGAVRTWPAGRGAEGGPAYQGAAVMGVAGPVQFREELLVVDNWAKKRNQGPGR